MSEPLREQVEMLARAMLILKDAVVVQETKLNETIKLVAEMSAELDDLAQVNRATLQQLLMVMADGSRDGVH